MFRVFRHYIESRALLALVCEFFIFAFIFYSAISLVVEVLADAGKPRIQLTLTTLLFSLLVTALVWGVGLYDPQNLRSLRGSFFRLLLTHVLLLPATLLLTYLSIGTQPVEHVHKLTGFVLAAFTSFSASVVFRALLASLTEFSRVRRRVLVLGGGERAAKVKAFVDSDASDKLEIVAFLITPGEQVAPGVGNHASELGTEKLLDFVRRQEIDEIVVAATDRRGLPVNPLLECRMTGVVVTDYLSFWEREGRKIMLDSLDPSWLIYSDGFRLSTVANELAKRAIDLAIGATFLVMTMPLMLLVAVLIKLDSPGPVIYRQERVGREGRPFVLYKFRSMRADAEKMSGPQWAAERDPRITRLGNFIRKTRIDEVPQVFNVLKGDMSFIGPRPERPFFVESLARDIPYYNERHRVAPGITGWAQINYPYGASVEDAREKLSYDLYYIKNYSLILDLLVLLETIQVVFWPKGVR